MRTATGFTVIQFGFYQKNISSTRTYLLRSLGLDLSSNRNGLWTCRQNGDARSAIPVGLYQMGREYNFQVTG